MPATPAHSSTSMDSSYSPNSSSSSRQSPSRYAAYDSPSRQIYAETRRRRRRSNYAALGAMDSPSRQLIQEFNQMIIHADHSLNMRLDVAAADHAKSYQDDLAAAASEHARVLRYAEGELKIELMELERQRIEAEILQARRDEEKRIELERIERQKEEEAEKERQRVAALKRESELREQKRKEEEEQEARRKAEAEAEQKKKAAQAEADRKAKAAADAAAAEKARQAAQQAQQASQPTPGTQSTPAVQPTAVSPSPLSTTLAERKAATLAEREATHKRYLDLHKKLKEFRERVERGSKDHPQLAKGLGEFRRGLTIKAGQISSDKTNNSKALGGVRDVLRSALNISNPPMIDIRPFIVQPIPPISRDSDAGYPMVLLYLFNIFAKRILAQFVSEASKENNPIDPIGLMAVSIFSDDEFKWNGISMIDILLAKLHAACPVLFGIYGRENTQQGRVRLGWQRQESEFVEVSVHNERMLGFGAGFASMTLRIFRNKTPPIPGSEYWRALSCIVNTPPEELTATHFIVLNGMLKSFVEKFITQFGQPALAALKLAVIDLPQRVTDKTPNEKTVRNAAGGVNVLNDLWKRDLYLTLA